MTPSRGFSQTAAEYRELTEDINKALYALVILRSKNEQLIQTHPKEEIQQNLQKGVKILNQLLETHADLKNGSLVYRTVLREADVTLERLQQTREILSQLSQNPRINSQSSLEANTDMIESIAESTLQELDQAASAEFENKYDSVIGV